MGYGANLHGILGLLHLNLKKAADDMGLYYNTLSNVINEKVIPTDETKEKIENFIVSKGHSVDELTQKTPIIQNFRIRTLKELSGNEKSAVKKFLIGLAKKIVRIEELKENSVVYDHFDLYTYKHKGDLDFPVSKRRPCFLRLFNKNCGGNNLSGKRFFRVISKIDESDSELLYRYSEGNIIDFIETLGIRLYLQSFGSKKIESCSFGFHDNEYIPEIIFTEPSIIINLDVCQSYEKAKYVIAKELYKMLRGYVSKENEYSVLNYSVELESTKWNNEAIKFADSFLVPDEQFDEFLKPYIESMQRKKIRIQKYDTMFFIDKIKNTYTVEYELVIKKLIEREMIENDRFNEFKKKYLSEWEEFCKEYEQKKVMIGAEPNGHPISYVGLDFFENCVRTIEKEIK